MLSHNVIFPGSLGATSWRGRHVESKEDFASYLRGPVKQHLLDAEFANEFQESLAALASTGMASETLRNLLDATSVTNESSDIAESIAACILKEEHEVVWPWNRGRDKLNPRASQQGVDLAGFKADGGSYLLVLGEVKRSESESTPPSIMYGDDGLIGQLEKLASDLTTHVTILKWLYARCKETSNYQSYCTAIKRYLESEGKDFLLFGFLMRDTEPNESDIKARATSLSSKVQSPCKADLNVWYFPAKITEWSQLMSEEVQ